MNSTQAFIRNLETLNPGALSLLRRSQGQPLDRAGPAFDLFTGLWWPLREISPRAPQRWCSWLVAKLYGSFPLASSQRHLAQIVGAVEPGRGKPRTKSIQRDRDRFRFRFDTLLTCPDEAERLEPHLRWCLQQIKDRSPRQTDIDWVQLLNDLCDWHQATGEVQTKWASDYLNLPTENSHD